MNNFTFSKS